MRGVLSSVGTRAKVKLMFDSRLVSIGHGVSVRIGSTDLSRTLSGLLTKAGMAFRVGGGGVCFVRGGTSRRSNSQGGGMSKIIGSTANRPVVNTGIIRGKINAGKIVAGLSKRFALRIPRGTSLVVDCVNCLRRSISAGKGSTFGVVVGRSAGALSRIIMMKCKIRGGMGLAKTITTISSGSLRGHPMAGISGTVRKLLPKMAIVSKAKRPKGSGAAVQMHNIKALGGSGPVCIMSNLPMSDVGRISPDSVRGVSMLGSTSSTTVCNSHTTGKMVLVAAGGKKSGTPALHCSNCIK